MPEKTYNATLEEKLATCEKVYNKSKFAADGEKAKSKSFEISFSFADCRTNKSYITNGVLACDCWSKAAIGKYWTIEIDWFGLLSFINWLLFTFFD